MTDQSARIARSVVVRGRVQGVFFRDSTARRATETGVGGWVSNEADGTVRAHLEGAPEAVDAMLAFVQVGPAQARVDEVEVSETEVRGMSTFRVR